MKYFLKYEGGGGCQVHSSPGKTTSKKLSFIRIKSVWFKERIYYHFYYRQCTEFQKVLPNTTTCRGIIGKSRVIYTEEELRLEKLHAKLLFKTMEVYRDNANDHDYVLSLLENYLTCKYN